MPWGPGSTVTTDPIAANLGWLFIFGATDSGKNLVTGTTYSTTLAGAAAYGFDSIGTYVGQTSNGKLIITTSTGSSFSGDFTYFITFSRDSAASVPTFSGLFSWIVNSGAREIAIQRSSSTSTALYYYPGGSKSSSVVDVSSITASTEYTFAVVFSGTTMKVFYTGGTSPISFTGTATSLGLPHYQLNIGGWTGTEWYPGRFRAFGRWSRALSDIEAQSMADNPQQIVAASVTYTYARPASDITTQWTTSSGTTHYTLIDETVADDNDYIVATAAGQTDEVKLQSMTPPQVGTNLVINYKVTAIDGAATVTVSLRQGSAGTLIKTDTAKSANGTYALTVAPADWAAVTDWSDLRLRFVSA